MSYRTDLYDLVESIRSISGPDGYDIRLNQLTIRTRTWDGPRLGQGNSVDSDLVLPASYPVRPITAQEVSSSSGLYEVGDILVDHVTPKYTPAQLNPTVNSNNVEILYVISSTDGVSGHPGWYRLIELRNYRPFTTQLVLRRRANDE